MVSIPPFLASLSHRYKKLLGSLHQICIGVGMIAAQSLSLLVGQPAPSASASASVAASPEWGLWRLELAVAVCLALALTLAGVWVDADDERAVEDRTAPPRATTGGEDDERQPLLGQGAAASGEQYDPSANAVADRGRTRQLGIREAFHGDSKYGGASFTIDAPPH